MHRNFMLKGNKMFGKLKLYYQKQPIYIKINLLHSIIVCGIVVFLVIAISQVSSDILIKQKIENSVKDLFAISEKLDMQFDEYEKDSLTIILNQEYQDMLLSDDEQDEATSIMRSIKFAVTLSDLYSSYTTIKKIRFYDTINWIAFGSYLDHFDNSITQQWDTITAFMDTKKSSDWTDFALTDKGTSYISLLRRVSNYNGKFVGVMELIIDENQVNKMYRNFESEGLQFLLVDADGRIVSCSDKTLLGKSLADKKYYEFVSTHSNEGRIFNIDDVPYIVICKEYKKLGYRLVGMIPKREIVGEVGQLVWIIIFIGFAGITVASVLVKWTARKTTSPLERVISVIDSVSHGDYSARVRLHTQDEFGELGSQLDEMIDNTVRLMELIRYQSEQKRRYELENLQMQINPHFLYNSLETVCGIIDAGEDKQAIRMINHISRFYRGVLSGGDTLVTIDQEVQITLRYLEIVKIRYRNSFEFDYDFPDVMIHAKTPKLILQPLVENSIVHGFLGKRKPGSLRIRGRLMEDKMVITITDNGCGIHPEELRCIMAGKHKKSYNGGGFGLRNIDERIKLVFGEKYGLQIRSKYGIGTRVSISLPLDEQGEFK